VLHVLAIGVLAALSALADLAPGPLQRGLDGAGCSYSELPASSAAAPLTLARAIEASDKTPAFLAVDAGAAAEDGRAIARIHVGGVEYTLQRSGRGGSHYVGMRDDMRVGIRARSRVQSTCAGSECEGTFRLVSVRLSRGAQHAQVSAIEHCGA
jgi:hypothetical protein